MSRLISERSEFNLISHQADLELNSKNEMKIESKNEMISEYKKDDDIVRKNSKADLLKEKPKTRNKCFKGRVRIRKIKKNNKEYFIEIHESAFEVFFNKHLGTIRFIVRILCFIIFLICFNKFK